MRALLALALRCIVLATAVSGLVPLGKAWAATISGTVFEDADFAGAASAYDGGTTDVLQPNVDVELYDADSGDAYLTSSVTNGSGTFSFTGLANGNYKVRVRSATIGDADSPPAGGLNGTVPGTWPYPLPELTWANGSALYGGQSATTDDTDTGDNAGPGDTWVAVNVSGADVTGIEFGFAYNLIVSTADDGLADNTRSDQGSLRQFLKNANAIGSAGGTTANSSRFRIPGAGPHTISPITQGLPELAERTTLDGRTQPGFAGDPLIILDGDTEPADVDGITIGNSGDGSTIRNLCIVRFSRDGIAVQSGADSVTIAGNWIGSIGTGATTWGNGDDGINHFAAYGVIGGTGANDRNVINNNVDDGLEIKNGSANYNVVLGNYIGLEADGTTATGNGDNGLAILFGPQGNTIGGLTTESRNVISSNNLGVVIDGPDNVVIGNYIGLDATGAAAGNSTDGIYVDNASNAVIGGTASGATNVISGNGDAGINLDGASTTGATIRGNLIGTNPAGTAAIPNQWGVLINGGANTNTIGGTSTEARNLLSGNTADGVNCNGSGVDSNVIIGNYIGTTADGTGSLPNNNGVYIMAGASDNQVGGTNANEANLIRFNNYAGVAVVNASLNNAILGNSIYTNTTLGNVGIDHGGNGVTANNGTKSASLPNYDMDHPVFTTVRLEDNTLTVAGYVGSAPNDSDFANARVEIHESDNDGSGFGEGKTYLGFVTTDGSGNFSDTIDVSGTGLVVGENITGTATDGSDNTSEFGAQALVVTDLVLHLQLEEGSGLTAFDSTIYNNDGTLNGGAAWTTGQIGGGVAFDYTDGEDYIEVPNSASLENVQEGNYTLAAWFNPGSTPPGSGSDNDANYGILIKVGWHTGLSYTNANRFLLDHVLTGDVGVSSTSTDTFTPGQYYHIVGVVDRDAGTLDLYVDGQHQDNSTFTPGTAAREYGTQNWKLGIANTAAPSWGWAADGSIDDARIYSRALTGAEVAALHAEGTPSYAITGRVFEDVDFAGTAAAYDGGVTDALLDSVDVELYDADAADAFVASTTTGRTASGAFSFTGLADGNYKVRVRSATIGDTDSPPAGGLNGTVPGTWPYPLPELTWADGSALYGGQSATTDDADTGDDAGPGDTYVSVSVSGADVTGVDFGFAYNLIVNTADDGLADNTRSDQGSLRQFLKNANAIGAAGGTTANSSQFRIPGAGPYTISPITRKLPSIVDRTVVDGRTQPGFASDPLIVLDGNSEPAGVDGVTIANGGDGSTVRNLGIVRFPRDGILVQAGADSVTLAGNWIGSNGSGADVWGNGDDGIDLFAAYATIGGTGPNDRNIINNSGDEGINIEGASATGNTILGNYIGLESDGSTGSGNTDVGIAILPGADANTIGGLTPEARNVISMNVEGIEINTTGNIVVGNYIGTDASGTAGRGNQSDDGVEIKTANGNDNQIGGTADGAGNLIAFNARAGVNVAAGTGNSILGNRLHSNTLLGIDLGNNDVTDNDGGDSDPGPNGYLNFPVITSATESGGTISVDFDLDLGGVLAGDYRIEFFKNPNGVDATNGEGEEFASAVTITHGGTGVESFSHSFDGSPGDVITATTTDSLVAGGYGSTSEFSAWYTITGPPVCIVDPSGTYVEAENFTGTIVQGTAFFTVESATAGYSGTGYLRSNGGGTDANPVHEGKQYLLHFSTAGTYNVWMRGYAIDGSTDSAFFGINGVSAGALNEGGVSTTSGSGRTAYSSARTRSPCRRRACTPSTSGFGSQITASTASI